MESTLNRLLKYQIWAMDRLFNQLEALLTVPPTALKLLQHIVNAESIWMSRVAGEKQVVGVWETLPLHDCRSLHQSSVQKLQTVLNNNQDLEQVISYVNTSGDAFSDPMHDIIVHVLNHSTYHRAQIAKEMRMHNIDPINTDYITYVRKK
ncbi:hypothetical protein GCM10011387_24410 [Pedobacter quisquiliarum]|uniref:Damage-inducible protein DinB n=1 Tax=Pedobacter quisquiliarum TaxID=1834438 RepID=A0A916XGH4_9SPHI|nr:DinB family protein [Pedobacter quisquiliarum]GGC70116.1 hypothetical protein GCM10011387_24410 [Pedobacter quisquiliarum]